MEETITISKQEYEQLKKDSSFLNILYLNGVDNWEWFGDSLDQWRKEDTE